MTVSTEIKRGFADVSYGQIHYRAQGSGDPMLLLHSSPGSSKQQVGLISDLGDEMRIFSPDTPGNGDSTALPLESPTIVDLATGVLAFLDTMGLDRVDVYGSHTGSAIASELAIMAPDRVKRIVLDGVQLLTDEERSEVLARYAFPFTPDLEGGYLMRAFQFCRDQYLFYPWYNRTREGQRIGSLPAAGDLHNWVVEVLKSAETYHLNYRAAFQWSALDRLPLVRCPTLVIAGANDPLFVDTETVAPMLLDSHFLALPRFDAPDYRSKRKAAIIQFFRS